MAKPPKITNFTRASSSRKRSADTSDDEPAGKKKGKILKSGYSLHWELRRRGLVNMPDGQWLPERIAHQMQEGKRFPGYGDCGLGPGKADVDAEVADHSKTKDDSVVAPQKKKQQPEDLTPKKQSPPTSLRQSKLQALANRFGFPPTKRYRRDSNTSASLLSYNAAQSSPASVPSPAGKRKRSTDDEDAAAVSPASKKTHLDPSSDESDDADLDPAARTERAIAAMHRQLRELHENMDVLEREEKPWMREQSALLAREHAAKGGYAGLNGGVRDESGY
jgi:hypothetical protein